MGSLIPNYEYDIFISYRQNDNKRDKWVTQFVEALKSELESTVKNPVSIYFDENPHDGLLETHQVGATLDKKLKCLIFVPIISQTYCDPNCYAWQQELLPFIKMATEDQLGVNITLRNGNVASRVLPIRIHDLDLEDKNQLEEVLRGPIRSIDFIHQTHGVNRPLNYTDDQVRVVGKILYSDQINKVAIALKELGIAILNPKMSSERSKTPVSDALINEVNQKSIVVLPFVNMSNDEEQEYFSDGLTEEIITDLSQLSDLIIISRSSAMTYKGSSKKITEIAQELNVQHVLEGSVRKSGNRIRITAQLIDALTDGHLWAEKYDSQLEDIFDIQENVSRAIVDSLKVKLNKDEDAGLSTRTIENPEAFDYILQARMELQKWTIDGYSKAIELQQKALEINGPNARIYAEIALGYFNKANMGHDREDSIAKAEINLQRSFELDPEIPEGHLTYGLIEASIRGKALIGLQHMKKAHHARPKDFGSNMWLFAFNFVQGKREASYQHLDALKLVDPGHSFSKIGDAFIELYQGNYEAASPKLMEGLKIEPKLNFIEFFYILNLACVDAESCKDYLNENDYEFSDEPFDQLAILLKHILTVGSDQIDLLISSSLENWAKQDPQYSHLMALILSFGNLKNDALKWLEHAVSRGYCNYPWLSTNDPLNELLSDEPRFQELLPKVKKMWNEFE